jgi:hypothetical protein
MTDQIKHMFYDASTDECNVNKREYFGHISVIAAFIAARLQYQSPLCNDNRPVSTIMIDQHKEKFGDVRIYCTLANNELVRCMWKVNHLSLPRPAMPETFKDECWLHDAQYYRRCYRDMVSLVPQYENAIIDAADHGELLHDDVAKLDAMPAATNTYLCSKYGDVTPEQLIEKLRRVYV